MANISNLMITPQVEARFWSKVDKTPGHGPKGECWVWIAAHAADGYPGGMTIARKKFRASHVALAIAGRSMPRPGMYALHDCDHRPCVRAEHLRWGTELENTQDAIERWSNKRKGRSFSPDEIRAIRASNDRQCEIAREYGVTQACICNIRKRISHKHVE